MSDLRVIPSIEQLRQREAMRALETRYGREALLDVLRAETAGLRERLSSGRDLHEICRSLVNDSNARGGIDNVTVVLLKIEEEEDGEDTQGTKA